ncbi:hypothetical protein SNOG_00895 [Parastagonospora nodorum SN15]|uniref:Uncharacterized protein n=1 Tax=Phaeosphaeria nodorum (strain SN15 / ATCC MYA-4574 / FGSC 10173) TaxID=321614 RepID=Q0V519_PHANO|nr:hypothetical protein SNOG_00895 [Parastagonospora nodorum SN15]EAT92390.1 hypothetical protein SNOG_00895 [Parastagonospora nodorum SN15]
MATNPIAPPLCLTFARCLMTRPLSGPGNTRTPGNQAPKDKETSASRD